jgi:hypothetical protein
MERMNQMEQVQVLDFVVQAATLHRMNLRHKLR